MTPAELNEPKQKIANRRQSPLDPFVLIPKVFFTHYEPTWKATLAYSALVYYSHTLTASCELVTMTTMAQRVRISRSTFLRGLEELKRKGIVTVRHRSKKDQKGRSTPLPNLYELVDLQPNGKGPPI